MSFPSCCSLKQQPSFYDAPQQVLLGMYSSDSSPVDTFFGCPEFTSAVGDFLQSNCGRLEYISFEEEQPFLNHTIFSEYADLIELQLARFIQEEGLPVQGVLEACAAAQASDTAGHMTCIDFLVASMEYESFMELCYDHLCSTSLGIARDEDVTDGGCEQDQDASGQEHDDSSNPNDSSNPAASDNSSGGVCGASASGSSDADAVHGLGMHCNSHLPSGDARAQGMGGGGSVSTSPT
ncbi:MAG: hypothetical protein WDW38_004161 [Sanguina aurantia]